MRRVVRILAWLAGVAVLLMVGIVVFVTVLFDPNDYKESIADLIKEQTGRQLRIHEDLKVSFFPWLAVETGRLELSNPPGFDDTRMLELKGLRAGVRLVPLLGRELEIDTVVLIEPTVHLITDGEGNANWQDLTGKETASGSEPAGAFGALAVEGVSIENGTFIWEDQQAGSKHTLQRVNVSTGELLSGEPVDVEVGFAYMPPELTQPSEFEAAGTITFDQGSNVVSATGMVMKIGSGDAVSMTLAFDSLLYDIGKTTVDAPRLTVKGNISSDQIGLEPGSAIAVNVTTGLDADLGKLSAALADATAQIAHEPHGNAKINLAGMEYDGTRARLNLRALAVSGTYQGHQINGTFPNLDIDFANQTMSVNAARAQVDGASTIIDLEVEQFLGELTYRGRIESEEFRPANLFEEFGIEVASRDSDVFDLAQFSAVFEGSLTALRLSELVARLDQTEARGQVQIDNFAEPIYSFAIDVDSVDIDRYAPAESDDTETGAAIIVLPVGLFRGLDVNGELKLGQLRVSGLQLTNLDVKVVSSAEGMTIRPIKADLYEGSLQGEVEFRQEGERLTLLVRQTMNDVAMGPMLTDANVTDRVEGRGQLSLEVEAIEAGGEPVTRGVAEFRFFDGAIRGLNLRKLYLQARQIYQQQKGREQEVVTDDREEFSFTEMTGSIEFNERIASNDDLQIKSPLFRIGGRGQADLQADKLDYLVNATVVESAKGQGGEELAELRGVNIPIRVSGSLRAPVYHLDVEELVKQALQQRIEKEARKVEEKIEEKIQKKLGDELQKLFKLN